MGEPWVTLEELAAYLSPRAPRDLSSDVLAQISIEGACDLIRTRAEQQFDHVETTVFYSGRDSRCLVLPQAPVIAVDEVRVDGEVVLDYELLRNGVLRRTEGRWPDGDGNVEVDYEHGYLDGAMPSELRLLALTVAARHYQQGIAAQESTGNASVTFSVAAAGDLSSGEQVIIAKYRRPAGEHLAPAVAS